MAIDFVRKIFVVVTFSILAFSGDIMAQDPDSIEAEKPYQMSVTYTGEFAVNAAGGSKTGSRYLDNIDVDIKADLGSFHPELEGTTIYFYGMGNQGGSISELAGDLQGISNIETENSWRIYEMWVQKKFISSRSSLLFGLYDINSEFNFLESSQLFLNSSHGIDPTIASSGELGPSIFPYTSLGTRVKVNPYGGVLIQAAVLDGIPSDPNNTRGTKVKFREGDGLFMIAEVGLYSTHSRDMQMRRKRSRISTFINREKASKNSVSIGGWVYTSEKDGWNPNMEKSREFGGYALGEYVLAEHHDRLPPIHIFGRLGFSNGSVSQLSAFAGGGFTIEGLFESRAEDNTGFAIAHAIASSEYRDHRLLNDGAITKSETNYELTHSFTINANLQLQANIQYVVNPGLAPNRDNALVFAMRGIVGF